MRIAPKDDTLYNRVFDLLTLHETCKLGENQVRIDNYLINIHYGPTECLVFNDNEEIVDGFVKDSSYYWVYKGKLFSELLGGIDGVASIASPINPSEYSSNIHEEQIHPNLYIWLNEPSLS
jgi:hypothetical protein